MTQNQSNLIYLNRTGVKFIKRSVYLEKLFIAHMKIDELLAENSKLQCQVGPKPEKTKQTPNFYNTFSHFPKFKDSSETSFIQEKPFLGQIKRPSLNKSFTSFSNDDKMKNVEVEFQKNSENIEKLKHELRFHLNKFK